jgi:uncharacterized protein
MQSRQGQFVWYELMTTDVAAAKSFYRAVVGWDMQDMPMPGMTYTVLSAPESKSGAAAQIGGLMGIPPNAAGMRPCWAAYVSADDVDAAAAKVTRLGGSVCRPPDDIPNVGRFAVVADPQGAMFNLFKPMSSPQGSSGTDFSMAPGHVGWNELHSSDAAKAFDFYQAMFGWSKGDALAMGELGTYQLFKTADAAVGGMFNDPAAASGARYWMFYIGVDHIDAALKRVTAAGGRVLHGPQQVPGGAWILQACDPQGAMFALLAPPKS